MWNPRLRNPRYLSKARPRLPRPISAERPVAVDPQDVPQGGDQLLDPVADAGIAELAEEGEVLADLGVVDRQGRAELAAGDRGLTLALERLRAGGGRG